MIHILILNYFLLLFYSSALLSVDIGSDTAVTRFNTTQTVNNGDRIAGFAALYKGFSFSSANVSGIFDSFFPVYDTVSLTGGTLILNKDLYLRNLNFGFFGNIYGNTHTLQFSSTSQIPSLCGALFNCAPFFVTQINVGQDAETLSWDYSEQYLCTASDDGLVRMYSYNGSALTFVTSISSGGATTDGVGQVAFRPNDRILALAREAGTPNMVFTFTFNVGAGTLTTISSLPLAADARACAWHPSGSFLAVGNLVGGGQVIIYPVDAAGVINAAGAVTISTTNNVYYECIAWNKAGTYLAVGLITGGGNPELLIIRVNTSPLSIVGVNASVTLGRSIGGLDWGKGDDFLAVGLQGTVGANVQVYSHNPGTGGVGAGSLALLASTSDIGRTTEGISWAGDLPCFSASSDELAGIAYFNTYSFTNNTLSLITSTQFTGLAAGDDFEATRWGPIGRAAAVSGDDNIIRVYGLPLSSCYTMSNLNIINTSNCFFHDMCITFTGINVWDGMGNTLEFDSTCTFLVSARSSLMFKDMEIIGLGNNNIKNLDSTSTITFNNARILLKNNYTFDRGKIDFINDVTISGNNKSFVFTSTSLGTVQPNSSLTFNDNTTFRYAPSSASRNFFILNRTSELTLKNATLSTSNVGLQLLDGSIIFDGIVSLVNEGTSSATSLEFGNNSISRNPYLEIMPASNVTIQGYVNYSIV